jgi:allophanate hydrolase subunit 2
LVDGPVTGGYPVIGLVPRLDHARLAQAAPGSILRFRRATIATVRRLGAARASAAADRDGIVLDEGDLAAGWAG